VGATGLLRSAGELTGSTSITTSVTSSDLKAKGELVASSSVTLSTTGDLVTTTGTLAATTSIAIAPTQAFLSGIADISGSTTVTVSALGSTSVDSGVATPLLSGFSVYNAYPKASIISNVVNASRVTLSASEPITFSATADLSVAGVGVIVGSATITWGKKNVELTGQGRLLGVTDVTISTAGVIVNGNADQVVGATTITFSESADVTATGSITGSASVSFSENADLSSGPIEGTATVSFSTSAELIPTVQGSGTASIAITATGEGRRLADAQISGTASFAISGTAEPVFGGGTFVFITPSGALQDASAGLGRVGFSRNRTSRGFLRGTKKYGFRAA
jgi:hypothetical protein